MPQITANPLFIPVVVLGLLLLATSSLLTLSQSTDTELDELLAIDDELESQGDAAAKPSQEATILQKAQRYVVELSNENVGKVVDGNMHVMVLGYTPWCDRSAELMPRFAEAATVLREMMIAGDGGGDVVMAKLDAERYPKAAGWIGIKGYPTLLLFVNGSSQPYRGGFTTEEIVLWIRKKTGAPTIRLDSIASAKEFLAKHHEFVVGFFRNYEAHEYVEFKKSGIDDNALQFVETNQIDVAELLFPNINHAIDNFIGLVKSEAEKFVVLDEIFKEEKILKFVDLNKYPLISIMTEHNSAKIFNSAIKLQIFVIAKSDDFIRLHALLQDIAKKYKTRVMFIYVNVAEENIAKPFLTLFGIETSQSNDPIVIAFNGNIGSKYMLELDVTSSNIDEFCSGLIHGTIAPYFNSERIPDNNKNESVKKVVGKTFDSLVLESSENVFLEVYTHWCMDCKSTTKKVRKLSKYFKDHTNLKFARIDASLNEHPKLKTNAYPTLLFYPKGDKYNPISVDKKSSMKDIAELIKKLLRPEEDNLTEDQNSKDEL